MARPPKPREILVDRRTHHSLEVSWEPYFRKLQARLKSDRDRLRVEVQFGRSENSWEVAYKGHDVRCVLSDLGDDADYFVRFRFGNNDAWGDFSNPQTLRTLKKPFSGEDIHRQIRMRNEEMLMRILQTGDAQVDAPDDRGFSPLTVAALDGQLDLCQLLLDFGADINWAGENGKTCLMLVACKGKPDTMHWLVDNGADLHRRDRRGMTPLHYAVDGEQSDMTRQLLERKADLHARDNQGCSALIRCAMLKTNGKPAVAAALIGAGARLDDTDASGQSALFYCVINRHEKMAAALLEHGADPNTTNTQGVSAFKVAETQERKNMSSLLREHINKRMAN